MSFSSLLLLLALSAAPLAPEEIAEPTTPQRLAQNPLDPQREARVQRLGKLLRCPLCQGMSIADSPSSTARAQLEKVRELVKEGKSDQEIFDYFVARYGDFALLEPRFEGLNLAAWLGPVVLLVFGFFVILSQVRRKGSPRKESPAPAPAQDGALDDYLRQVRSEVEK